MSDYKTARDAYKANVEALAASKFYAGQTRANRYFAQNMAEVWAAQFGRVGLPTPENLERRFGITPTMLRIFHLFGRTVHGVGIKTKVHLITHWPPTRTLDAAKRPILFRGVSTPDIARIIEASDSAVRGALKRIKGDESDGMFALRLMTVLPSDAGITLDGMFTEQTSFAFVYDEQFTFTADEYQRAIHTVEDARVADATRTRQVIEWCSGRKDRVGHPVSVPITRDESPPAQSGVVAVSNDTKTVAS